MIRRMSLRDLLGGAFGPGTNGLDRCGAISACRAAVDGDPTAPTDRVARSTGRSKTSLSRRSSGPFGQGAFMAGAGAAGPLAKGMRSTGRTSDRKDSQFRWKSPRALSPPGRCDVVIVLDWHAGHSACVSDVLPVAFRHLSIRNTEGRPALGASVEATARWRHQSNAARSVPAPAWPAPLSCLLDRYHFRRNPPLRNAR